MAYNVSPNKIKLTFLSSFSLLETMQRPWRGYTGHTGSVDGAELDFRDVESDGGGLKSGLHHFQRTSQNSTHCTSTSRREQGLKKKMQWHFILTWAMSYPIVICPLPSVSFLFLNHPIIGKTQSVIPLSSKII